MVKFENGKYYINGMEATPIDLNNITPSEHHMLEKIRLNGTHREAASHEAMVIGIYKIYSVEVQKPKIPQDDPNRYIATVTIKGELKEDFDESFRVKVRLNPLFNKSAKGSGPQAFMQHSQSYKKCDNLYKSLENKMIHIKSIDLVENKKYGTSVYVYDWEWLK